MRQEKPTTPSSRPGRSARLPPSSAARIAAWMAVSITLFAAGAVALVLRAEAMATGDELQRTLQAQRIWTITGAALLGGITYFVAQRQVKAWQAVPVV